MRHVPWHGKFDILQSIGKTKYLELFEVLISSLNCPLQVRISFERSKQRYFATYKNKEATTKEQIVDYSKFSVEASEETRTLVTLPNLVSARFKDTNEYDSLLDYGKTHDWSLIEEKASECISTNCFLH